LGRFDGLTAAEIDLAICYVAVASPNLQQISYPDLLDKFLINNSRSMEGRGFVEESPLEEELSLG
jgi:hypothetical protein